SVLIHERVEDLLAQEGPLVLFRLGPGARGSVLQGALDADRVVQDAQLEAEIPVPGVVALQREETQLTHGEAKVFELFDVEARPSRDGAGDEPRKNDQITPRRERELDAISRGELLHGLGHDAPAA